MCLFLKKATKVILGTYVRELISNSEATQHWKWLLRNNQGEKGIQGNEVIIFIEIKKTFL